MFGQATSPFASPSGTSTPFGGGGGQAGQSTFGAAPSAFGAQPAAAPASGFGAFGSPAPAPAAGGFGGFQAQNAAAPSGATGFSGFSSSAPTPAFGQPSNAAPTPFGSPAPAAPSGGLFSGGGTGTTAFGASQQTGFGSGTAGGFNAQASTAPFGAQSSAAAPAGGAGLFGGGGTTGAFGASTQTAFGTTANAGTGGFAASTTSTGLFGSSAAPSTGFAAGGGSTGFGASTTSNMFPAPGAASNKPGTVAAPYQVTSKTDGSTMINLQTITAMAPYEGRSPEELRLEDYVAGNKGTMGQAQPAGQTGGFAAPAPAFGQAPAAPAPAFGQAPAAPAPAFGQAPAAPAPAFGGFTGGFGAASSPPPAPAGASLFGSTTAATAPPAPGLFGAPAAAPPAGGSLFGSTAPATAPPAPGLFGAPATSQPAPAGGSLFGSTTTATPSPAPGLFGAPAPAPPAGGSLFGSTTPATAPPAPGLFGAPATSQPAPAGGSLFGSTTTATAPPASGLFGAPAPAPPAGGSLFGSSPTPAPFAGGSLFGSTTAAPSPAPGLFGAPAAPQPAGGLFQTSAPATPAASSLFGAAQPLQTAQAPSVAPPPTADALLAQQLAAIENQKKELALLEAWRGQAPSGSSVIPTSLSEKEATGRGLGDSGSDLANRSSTYAASSGLFLAYQAAPRSAAKIKPRGFAPVKSPSVIGSVGNMGASGSSSLLSPDSYLGSSAKRLVIKPGSLTPKPKMRLLLTDGNGDEKKEEANDSDAAVSNGSSGQKETPSSVRRDGIPEGVHIGVNTPSTAGFTSPMANGGRVVGGSPSPGAASASSRSSHAQESNTPSSSEERAEHSPESGRKDKSGGLAYDFYRQVVGSPDENGTTPSAESSAPSYVPKLTKGDGYEVKPSLAAMADMSEADLAAVSGFEVSRGGFGSIAWEGAVDVRGVDLDSVVSIEARDVAVYDAEEEDGTKPPEGSKLNRPAIITMYDIFPKDGGASASGEARSKMEKKIAKSTKKMGAELISYNPATGVWKFRVKHFSRYCLDGDGTDDEEEEEAVVVDTIAPSGAPAAQSMDFDARGRAGRPRGDDGRSVGLSMSAILDEDDNGDMSETDGEDSSTGALTSEGEGMSTVGAENKDLEASMQAANNAYTMLSSQMAEDGNEAIGAMAYEEVAMFDDEGETASEYCLPRPRRAFVEQRVVPTVAASDGISAKIAKRLGIGKLTSCSTDFGLRMGRSFRVSWRPDGSVVFARPPCSAGTMQISQRRPMIGAVKDSLPLLQVHLKNSVSVDGGRDEAGECPSYTLPTAGESGRSSAGSYKALCATLDDFSEAAVNDDNQASDPEVPRVVPRAFSLLSTLYGQEGVNAAAAGGTSVSNERRSEGIKLWLCDAVCYDMMEAIKRSEGHGDSLQSIFEALSGGNITKASTMAIDQGHLRLATLLSSSDLQSRGEMQSQYQLIGAAPSIPAPLRRIYAQLGGDQGVEEDLYQKSVGASSSPLPGSLDWRRRLALRFYFSSDNPSLPSVLGEFKADIARGVSPAPVPRYASGDKGAPRDSVQDECILYQVLQTWASNSRSSNPSPPPLSALVNPPTHTDYEHDFSMTFHLASALSAIGCCLPLTTTDEARLVDSYVHQLLSIGMWEWAVYVCICSFTATSALGQFSELWKKRAADIILRFYPSDESHDGSDIMPHRSSFLHTKVGIPEEWFYLASANRSLYCGDPLGYVNNIVHISPIESVKCYEEQILPTELFDGNPDYDSYFALLDKDTSGIADGSVFQQLVLLCKDMLQLSRRQQRDKSYGASIQRLKDLAFNVQDQLQERSTSLSSSTRKSSWPVRETIKGGTTLPLSVFYAEASAWVAFMQLQLAALEAGHSVFDDGGLYGSSERRRLKQASQLSHLASTCVSVTRSSEDTLQPFLGSSDFIRGEYGVI